jgi:replicative DNA helicase
MTEQTDEPAFVNHDRNAELAVLSCCLHSRIARDEAKKHLVGGDFYRPEHETIWDAMLTLDRKGEQVDPARVMSALSGHEREMRLLPSLLSYPAIAATVGDHARVVRSWATKRRLYDEALRVQQIALNPTYEAETVAAETVTRFTQVRDSGVSEDVHSITLGELLETTDDEPDWLIPGLLERRDRFMLTGQEGLGKSFLLRQMAIMAAAGLHPFDDLQHIRPVRAMIIDCENTEGQVRRKTRGIVAHCGHYGQGDPRMVNLLCSPRIDITRDRDLARIHYEMDACQPELVVIGPLYRLTNKAIQSDDEAAPLLAALDTIRDRGCALLIEAHAGHSVKGGGQRDLRPRGSSALLGWPEFGYGMRAVAQGYADLETWRGDRDERDWPERVKHDREGIRWIQIPATPIGQEWGA